VEGNLPRNSGLSSSASFTVGMAKILNDLWGVNFERIDIFNLATLLYQTQEPW
jgi:galactokinase